MHYYDLVLAAIGVSVVLGLLVGYVTPVPATAAVVVFGTLGFVLILHALFVRGPVDSPGELTDEVDVEELPVPGLSK